MSSEVVVMEGLFSSPRRKSSDDNMIPLINIVFLLLIFFMIAGQIRNLVPGIELPVGDSEREAVEADFELSLNQDRVLFLNGEEVDPALLPERLVDVEHISLVVDRRLSAKDLDEILAVLRDQSTASVNLLLENTTNVSSEWE